MGSALGDVVRGFKAMLPIPNAGWSAPRWIYPGLRGERDYTSMIGDGTNNSIVEAVIGWAATNFPEAPFAVYKYADTKASIARIDRLHPLARKIRRPNPYYSGVVLWHATIRSFMARGDAYWIKRRDPLDRVAEYWWCPHWMIEPRGPDDPTSGTKYVDHYDYTPNGKLQELDARDVFHLRDGIDGNNPMRGLSRLAKLFREIATDEEAARWTAALLTNGAMPGLVIAPQKDAKTRPTPEEKEAIKQRYMQKFGGDHRGEPIVMSSPTDVHQFGFDPKSLDLAALRDIPEERVTAVLEIPAAVVGLGPGMQGVKVGKTLEEYRDQAWESKLIPTGHGFGEEAWLQLLPDWIGDERLGLDPTPADLIECAFDLSKVAVLQESQLKKANIEATKMRAGITMRSEARAALGYEVRAEDEVFSTQPGVIAQQGGTLPGGTEPEPVEPEAEPVEGDGLDTETDEGKEQSAALLLALGLVGDLRKQVDALVAKSAAVDPNLLALLERGEKAAEQRDAANLARFAELAKAWTPRSRTVEKEVLERDSNGHIQKTRERELVAEEAA